MESSEQPEFRITPIRPIAEIQAEALVAHPPKDTSKTRDSDLVELVTLDSTIVLDVRYATTNNFMGTQMYKSGQAFLQRPAATALLSVQNTLRPLGLGLVIYDAYRPWYVTKMFWEATPPELREFVANPDDGSRHNRGCAVDLGLVDLTTGSLVEMPSGYDEFSERAHVDFAGGSKGSRSSRDLLRAAMEEAGFEVYKSEWWHYDFKDWKSYAVQNIRFESVPGIDSKDED